MEKILQALAVVREWFTPARRKAVYLVLATVLGLAATFGWISTEQVEGFLTQVDKILGAVALLLAASNVEKAPDATEG